MRVVQVGRALGEVCRGGKRAQCPSPIQGLSPYAEPFPAMVPAVPYLSRPGDW